MNNVQKHILELSKTTDISSLGIRELARRLNVHPQTAKYHKEKLQTAGYLKWGKGLFSANSIAKGILGDEVDLVTIPFLGSANCGPATMIAGSEPLGVLKISSRLMKSSNYGSLFALQASGSSMNMANLAGEKIFDDDYVLVDSSKRPKMGDYVVAVVNGLANIKKFYPEYIQGQLVRISLISESTDGSDPIFIHPEDQQEGLIAGVAIQVIRKPIIDD